jgi:isoleucyl-tRNA synthetase
VFKITNEDVDITTDDIPGMAVASEQGVTIAVDLKLSPELIQEGLAREAVNRIQTIRKEQNFDITDRINLWVNGDLKIIDAIKAHSNYVSSEVLAISLNYSSSIPNDVIVSQVELDGHDMIFGLKK